MKVPYKTPEELDQLIHAVLHNQVFTGLHVLELAPDVLTASVWLDSYFPTLRELAFEDKIAFSEGRFVPYGYLHEMLGNNSFPILYWLRHSDAKYIMYEAANKFLNNEKRSPNSPTEEA
jgi:hypothetical protein